MRNTSDCLAMDGLGSLHLQLYRAIRDLLLQQLWPAGSLLPSSRQLANDLQLSRNTVNQALQQLVAEGYIQAQPGKGFIASELPESYFQPTPQQVNAAAALSAFDYGLPVKVAAVNGTLQPGVPDLAAFAQRQWRQLIHRHSDRLSLHGFAEPAGYAPLRKALAAYLRQSRQVICDEDNLLITSGAQQALYITACLVAQPGDTVLMEQPGYPRLKQALQLRQLQIEYIDAGSATGLDINQLPLKSDAKALFLTPGHQYPLGGIMPLPNRLAVLDWAKQQQCWLIEDDYDSEYQYQHRPVASLQGLAGGEGVLFCGSFSKTLFPALRLGYLVAPKQIVTQAAAIQQALQGDTPLLPQAVLADFISEGHFGRHLRKMRRHYQVKKQLAVKYLQQHLPQCQLYACNAGLHLTLTFPVALDEQALLAQLRAQGIRVQPLSRYYFTPTARCGLVIGIANDAMPQALEPLIRICQAALAQNEC